MCAVSPAPPPPPSPTAAAAAEGGGCVGDDGVAIEGCVVGVKLGVQQGVGERGVRQLEGGWAEAAVVSPAAPVVRRLQSPVAQRACCARRPWVHCSCRSELAVEPVTPVVRRLQSPPVAPPLAARAPPLAAREPPLQHAHCPSSQHATPAVRSPPLQPTRHSPAARSPPLQPARRPLAARSPPLQPACRPLAACLPPLAAREQPSGGPLAAPCCPLAAPCSLRSAPCSPLAAPCSPLAAPCSPRAALWQPARRPLQPAHRPLQPARRPLQPARYPLQPVRRPQAARSPPLAARAPPSGSLLAAPLAARAPPSGSPLASLSAGRPRPMASLSVLMFDHEGCPIQFNTWLDDLQLYLPSDSRDSVSLFDHTSGASPAPPATADSATRSQWPTRDATTRLAVRNHLPLAKRAHFGQHKTAKALYDAVVARYSSPATTALGRLILPYFAFAGVGASVAAVVAVVGLGVAVVAAVGVVAVAMVAVGVELFRGEVLAVARGSSSSVGARPLCLSSFTCGKLHTQHRCFSRLDDAWRAEIGDEAEHPRLEELLRSGVDIFALDYDAILAAMYALFVSAEGDCYLCVLPDPGIEAAALGASESALPGTVPTEVLHTLTLDSGASRSFFRDSLHLPSFSTNLVRTAALQDAMVTTTTPGGQRVSICTYTRTGRHLATFTRRPRSSLYTLTAEPPQVAAPAQVSVSGPVVAPCLCRLLSHKTLMWHHRLGHPSLPRWHALPPPFHLQLHERFREDLLVLLLHSDRGGEFSSDLLRDFCCGEGIL
ncbi:unnamed protein product [Closterium sp. NIES-54]